MTTEIHTWQENLTKLSELSPNIKPEALPYLLDFIHKVEQDALQRGREQMHQEYETELAAREEVGVQRGREEAVAYISYGIEGVVRELDAGMWMLSVDHSHFNTLLEQALTPLEEATKDTCTLHQAPDCTTSAEIPSK